jgi:hypothetical protein
VSFQAKVSATTKLDNVKCAIVAWSGTADSVTSDIISAWGAEGTNPTLIANATYENTPANLNVTTSWATYTVSAPIDTASTNNVIVFIWSDVTDTTAGDFLYLAGVQLEAGSVATPFERRPIGTELQLCQRYFIRSVGGNLGMNYAGAPMFVSRFLQEMRVAPSAVFVSGTAFTFDSGGQANYTPTGANFNEITTQSVRVDYTGGSWSTTASAGNACIGITTFSLSAEL